MVAYGKCKCGLTPATGGHPEADERKGAGAAGGMGTEAPVLGVSEQRSR